MKLKEKTERLKNNQNAITLIALVVTIVVLLILAAVTINLLLGDDGIFGKANASKDAYEIAQIKEEAEQLKVSLKIDELTNRNSERMKKSNLLSALQQHFTGSTLESGKVVVKNGKYDIAVVGDNLEIVVTKHGELKKGQIQIVYDYDTENVDDVLTIWVSANIGEYKTYEQYAREVLATTNKSIEEIFVDGQNYCNKAENWGEPTYNNISELMHYWASEGWYEATDFTIEELCEGYEYENLEEFAIDWGYVEPEGYYGKSYEQYAQEILDKLPSVETQEGMRKREQLFREANLYFAEQNGSDQIENMKSAQSLKDFMIYASDGELDNINNLNDVLDFFDGIGTSYQSIDEMMVLEGFINPKEYEEYQQNLYGSMDVGIEIIRPDGNSEYILSGQYISYDVYENGEYTFKAIGPNGEEITETIDIDITSVSEIQLEEKKIIGKGSSKKINATVLPSFVQGAQLTWTSSDNSVAKVDKNGVVTGIKDGNATITAKSQNGKEARCDVDVKEIIKISEMMNKTVDKNTYIEDAKGNLIVVPGGFKISSDSGTSVQQGIVIEDNEGNQFVWVPVSNINGDGSNKIIKDDGTEVEITLGRYTFAGIPKLIQKGSEYDQTTIANVANGTVDTKYKARSYFYELTNSRTSNEKMDITGTNTTAKDLAGFIAKTNTNKGFYIARYEASYGSGYNSAGTTTAEKYGNAKPLSKPSKANSTSDMNYAAGTLWNWITQSQAAIVSQNMYKNNNYVESDLINSYAWDTAIVYIQAMGNTNYAYKRDGNGTLKNTGTTGDEKCKIFDMAGNEREWTTEYSTEVDSNHPHTDPGTNRGGSYFVSYYDTSERNSRLRNYVW